MTSFPGHVMLRCTATVQGERIEVRTTVDAAAYEAPELREMLREQIRRKLMEAILEKWTPVIEVRR